MPLSSASKADSGGTSSDGASACRAGRLPPEGLAPLAQVDHLRAVVGRLVEDGVAGLLVGERHPEAVAEGEQRLLVHLLLLVGDVLALAGAPHAVALDRLGEDHRGLALVVHGGVVGGVDLARAVAARG